nr:MAG TPA: La-related protein 1-binding, RNA-binding, DM15, 5'TOP, RNA [Bacteriophage sp.]
MLVFQLFSYFWSHFLINFYKLMYAGMQKYI